MKRSPALDLLRGAAAFAVAIPHYLTTDAPFRPTADAAAVAGVEVFFVLSGFVLAPQIVDWVIGKPWRNLRVFLIRRWMRTIPPYVVALVAVALMTGNLVTADFLRYLFYVENLFGAANTTDFYPVAWSLGVEEWFYLLFAPLLFLVARLVGRSDRRLDLAFAIVVLVAVATVRLLFAPHEWDLDVRRVTVFRIDSIVWGYLLYLLLEKRPAPSLETSAGGRRLAMLAAALVAAAVAEFWISRLAVGGSVAAQQAFPYSSALFGMAAVGLARQADEALRGWRIAAFSFWLGRISYSAYLFHILVVMALKPRIADWPIALQLALYLAIVSALSTLFWRAFERPILAARPDYERPLSLALAPTALPHSPPSGWGSSERPNAGEGAHPPDEGKPRARPWLAPLALGLGSLLAGTLARNAFMANEPLLFYPALIATAVLVLALTERARRFTGGLGAAARIFVLFALALPAADTLYRSSTGVPLAGSVAEPTYSYRAAHENPTAFAMWWFYYLNEWIRDDGIRGTIEKPDPKKKLPFVLVPGSSGRMFDTTIRINAAGFRGPEIAGDKGGRFRIVALGESQTFGPTLRDGEKPWPERLQALFDRASCDRSIEVVNAGTEAYTLEDNLERMRRDVLPLKPDLILSSHGMNGFLPLGLRQQAEPEEPGARPRASALLGRAVLTIERQVHDWKTGHAPPLAPPQPLSDGALMKSRYAEAYRKLISLSRGNGVPIVLATSSMAVSSNSPREVKNFYGGVFKPIDDIIAANAAHNRLAELIGREQNAPVIDGTSGLDGDWDDDLYLDIVHFTDRGNERAAELMFRQLLPLLASEGVRCAAD
jgi:peptidoglycan/LPS O-acetylase OafA/YrhL/lysophospholipase L1-like esterase